MNWNAFKRLFHYLGRYKLRLILVMIAAVLSTLFTVLTPAVTGGITSELYDGVASGSFDWETIVWLLVTLIALYLVAQLFAILQSFSMTKLTACVMETLRGDIDRKMHHLKLDYYDSHIPSSSPSPSPALRGWRAVSAQRPLPQGAFSLCWMPRKRHQTLFPD